ncbi:MAG: MFS transporter [Chloroflexota bacterium]
MGIPLALIAALLFVGLADEWFSYFPYGAIESIRTELSLSYTDIGFILGSLSAGGLLGNAFPLAADYLDRRVLCGFGALGVACSLFAFASGHSLLVLVAAGFAWGAADDAFVHGAEIALVDLCRHIPGSRQLSDRLPGGTAEADLAAALGRVNALGAIGDLLGPLTIAAIAALGLSWRVAFLLGGTLMLLYALWLASQPLPRPTDVPKEPPAAAVLAVLRDRTVLLLGLVDALFGLLDEPLLGFLSAFMQRVRAFTPAASTALIALIVVAGFVGYVSVSAFRSRFPARALLATFAALLGLAIPVLILAPFLPLQLLAAMIFGFSGAAFYSTLQAAYLSLHPGQAGATGTVVSIIGFAGLGFPTAVGALSDAHGLMAGLALYAAVPVILLLLLALERRA